MRVCDHCPILVGSSDRIAQNLLMRCHLLQEPEKANHGMSLERLWLAATTGASTKVSQRTDAMPACKVLVYSRVAADCSQCTVTIAMGTRRTAEEAQLAYRGSPMTFAPQRLAVRSCHATAVSLVM